MPPMMGGQMGMPPMMGGQMGMPPMMGGQMGMGGGGFSSFTMPTVWSRTSFNYNNMPYDRRMPFMAPFGVSPAIAQLFMYASQIFRQFDMNFSGSLDPMEFRQAIWALGWQLPEFEVQRLWFVADSDRSGRISEREFCEFWVYINSTSNPSMYGNVFASTAY